MIFSVTNPVVAPCIIEEGENWKVEGEQPAPAFQCQCGKCNRLAPRAGTQDAATAAALAHGWTLKLFEPVTTALLRANDLEACVQEAYCPDCARVAECET